MKTKIVIENLETTIVLKPENEFDTDILEKMYNTKEKYSTYMSVEADYGYGVNSNHRIEISIKEIK